MPRRSPELVGVDLTSQGQNKDERDFRLTRLKTARVAHPQPFTKVAALYRKSLQLDSLLISINPQRRRLMGLAPPLKTQHFLCHFPLYPEESVIERLTACWSHSKLES